MRENKIWQGTKGRTKCGKIKDVEKQKVEADKIGKQKMLRTGDAISGLSCLHCIF